DVGDRADLRVAVLELGDEEHAAVALASLDGCAAAVFGVEGKRHDGTGQHNSAAQGHHGEGQDGAVGRDVDRGCAGVTHDPRGPIASPITTLRTCAPCRTSRSPTWG